MISMHVDAAFWLFEGFKKRPVQNGEVLARLNGQRVTPLYKTGGCFVLCGLPKGSYTITFEGARLITESRSFEADGGTTEIGIIMKPAPDYPFGRRVNTAQIASKSDYITAAIDGFAIKTARQNADKGAFSLDVYADPGTLKRVAMPGEFLIYDGKSSELCVIEEVFEGKAALKDPTKYAHQRAVKLIQAVRHKAEESFVCFDDAETAVAVIETNKGLKLTELKLESGGCANFKL